MKNDYVIPIALGTLFVVVVAVVLIASRGSGSPAPSTDTTQTTADNSANTSAPTQTAAQAQPATAPATEAGTEQTGTLAEQKQCATDGQSFVQTYEQANSAPNAEQQAPLWFTPQYHFNASLNTCLVYIGYTENQDSAADLFAMMFNGAKNSTSYTYNLTVANFVINIYSNQAVLQSFDTRTVTMDDSQSPATSQEVDTPSQYYPYQNVPNVDETTFKQQVQVLMNE